MKNSLFTSTVSASFPGYIFLQNGEEITCNQTSLEKNWVFIDMQNIFKAIQKKGWRIDWRLFRQYLKKNYNVTKAIVFMGYIKENEGFYNYLRSAGYALEFREVKKLNDGKIDGGNCDADLTAYAMDNKDEYEKAIIIADDGDYCRTIESLIRQNKFELMISSHSINNTSNLIKKIALKSIISIEDIKPFIEFKGKDS